MQYLFRPHHFLCALCFQGKGYSSSFVANFQNIADVLNDIHGDDKEINIVDHTDSICSPCPHRREKLCMSQTTIKLLDDAHAAALSIKPPATITWGEAKQRIKTQITLNKFNVICAPCEWKKYGICEDVLTKFLKD